MDKYQIYAQSLVSGCKRQAITEAFWETGCDNPYSEVNIQKHI